MFDRLAPFVVKGPLVSEEQDGPTNGDVGSEPCEPIISKSNSEDAIGQGSPSSGSVLIVQSL